MNWWAIAMFATDAKEIQNVGNESVNVDAAVSQQHVVRINPLGHNWGELERAPHCIARCVWPCF